MACWIWSSSSLRQRVGMLWRFRIAETGVAADVEVGSQVANELSSLVALDQFELLALVQLTGVLDVVFGRVRTLYRWQGQQFLEETRAMLLVQVSTKELHPKTSSHDGFIARLDQRCTTDRLLRGAGFAEYLIRTRRYAVADVPAGCVRHDGSGGHRRLHRCSGTCAPRHDESRRTVRECHAVDPRPFDELTHRASCSAEPAMA
jgi:hypothetical protein